MWILTRRFLALASLMFWQGGFLFYVSVVVPIGQRVLGSDLNQGLITRQVTNYLNLAGAVALVFLAWDAAMSADRPTLRRLRWLSWLAMFLALGLLAWLHGLLDQLIDLDGVRILDRRLFHVQHRSYLWVSTAQWACGIIYALLMLHSWRVEDLPFAGSNVTKGASRGPD
jgi:hypothetical protein